MQTKPPRSASEGGHLLLGREGRVVDGDLGALGHKGVDGQVQVAQCGGADARNVRIVDGAHARRRVRRGGDGRVLEQQARVGAEGLNELGDSGGPWDREMHGLALAHGTRRLDLVAHGAGEYPVGALRAAMRGVRGFTLSAGLFNNTDSLDEFSLAMAHKSTWYMV